MEASQADTKKTIPSIVVDSGGLVDGGGVRHKLRGL